MVPSIGSARRTHNLLSQRHSEPGRLPRQLTDRRIRVGSMSAVADDAPVPDRLQETARLLTACQVPERLAGPAVAVLGAEADQQLRADPWRLLLLPQIRPDQADWFARRMLGAGAGPQDPRRGRALTGYLLRRAARDGHTAVPAGVIAAALARLRIADPAQAVEAAVDEGMVLPFEAPDSEAGASVLLALARYAMAEEAVAEGLQRLTALAEPVPGAADALVGDEDNPIDEAQQDAVRAAAAHGVTVLCGGPGTGKSRTIAAAVAMAAGCGCGWRWPRRPAGPPGGWRNWPARPPARCTGCSGRRAARAAGCSPAPRTSPWTPIWSWWTRRPCWTRSWPPRWSRRAPTAPGCCWSATRRSCPRSGPAGCWPT